jgi:hypothetical protein
MRGGAIAIGLIGAGLLFGGDKKPQKSPVRSGENDVLELTATPLADPELVKQALGSDLGGHYILMDVQIVPKEGRKVAIRLDDFVLKTNKDGERTGPFAPTQIAGRGALVVTAEHTGGRGSFGIGPMSAGTADITENHTAMNSGATEKPNPILDVLKKKILPEKETEAPVSGLLYFPMEKQKLKDLELWYTTPDGKMILRFK